MIRKHWEEEGNKDKLVGVPGCSVGGVHNSRSQGCRFESHFGCGDYFEYGNYLKFLLKNLIKKKINL